MSLILALALAAQSLTDSEIENEAFARISMIKYGVCLSQRAAEFSSSSESAATVVDAAFGKCIEHRIELAGHLQKSRRGFTEANAEDAVATIDGKERLRLLGIVLERRAKVQ